MRLRWPQFEKRARRSIRTEIAGSPLLKAEYKRHRSARRRNAGPVVMALVIGWVVALGFGSFLAPNGETDLGLAVLSLWAAGSSFRCARRWFEHSYASDDLVVFSLLPLSDGQVFHIQWRRFLARALGLLIGYVYFYSVLWYVAAKPAIPFGAALLAAVAQAGMVLAFGLSIAAWLPFLPLAGIAGLLQTMALVLMFSAALLRPYQTQVYNFLCAVSPNGWINFLLLESATTQDLSTLILLLPVGIVLYASIYAWHRLKAVYSLEGLEFFPGGSGMRQEAELGEADFARQGPTEIQDNIAQGNFLKSVPWESYSWFERTFVRLLTSRERTILEFLVGEVPAWTKGAKWVLTVFMLGLTAVWIFGQNSGFAVFLSGYMLLVSVTPVLGSKWRGFAQLPSGGAFIPAFSTVPIGFGELTKLLAKFNLARLLLALPLLAAFTIFSGWRMGYDPAQASILAGKILLLLLAMQPLMVLLPMARGTQLKLWVILTIPGLTLMAFSALVFFTSQGFVYAAGGWLGSFVGAILFLLAYRWAYRRGKFDLLAIRLS
jgi:hypothetical protein